MLTLVVLLLAASGLAVLGATITSSYLVWLLVGAVFAAGLLNDVVALRYPLLVVAAATCMSLCPGRRGAAGTLNRTFLLLGLSLVLGLLVVGQPLTATLRERLFRYLLLYPAAVLVGVLLRKRGRGEQFDRAVLWMGLVSALLALFERVNDQRLFVPVGEATGSAFRYGAVRANALAEHPLVLGSLLLIALPAATRLQRRGPRLASVAVLTTGVLATGSRGPALLALVYLVARLVVIRSPQGLSAKRRPALMILSMGVVLGTLAVVSFLQADRTTIVTSSDPTVASAQYRAALYGVAFRELLDHPSGWGVAGLQPGELVIPSVDGDIDLSETIDSEFVLASFDFGFVGLALFVWILLLPVLRRSGRDPSSAEALLLLTLAGFFLALHAWTGLGTMWALLIGMNMLKGTPRPHAPTGRALTPARAPVPRDRQLARSGRP